MKTLGNALFVVLFAIGFVACSDDEVGEPPKEQATFMVSIENVMEPKEFLTSGTTGLLMPGESTSFSFHAGIGHYLSFATMFVQSNDLFYGFQDDQGLALYNNGTAVTGDVTSMVDLWDAGTEVNEEPGVGPNQAPRQSGPDTGADENGTVQIVNDGFTYPATADVIKVSIAHDGGTMFTVTIENVSGNATLPTPLAPGVWVVHGDNVQLFTTGQAASEGLEDLAEDGGNTVLDDALTAGSGFVSPLAPGVWAVHEAGTNPIFDNGQPDRGQGLEALAEDGDPAPLNGNLTGAAGVLSNGVFNTPVGAGSPGPLMPGSSYSFTFDAEEGDYLSLATMLVHTNDLFYAFDEGGIALFNNGNAVSGTFTASASLWDAGTEVNEYPGAGNNQPARGGADSGADENGNVRIVNDGFSYPATADAIMITISLQ